MTTLVWKAVDDLLPAERNPKKHDIPGIVASIRRVGFRSPPYEDEATGRLSAGHGRLESVKLIRAEFIEANALYSRNHDEPIFPEEKARFAELEAVNARTIPDGIDVRDGVWFIPVLRGTFHGDDAEIFLVADNRLTENGGWDFGALNELLGDLASREVDLSSTGFSPPDLEKIAREVTPPPDPNSTANALAPGDLPADTPPREDPKDAVKEIVVELRIPLSLSEPFLEEVRALVGHYPDASIAVA
jgi:hypothetical protein